MIKSHDFASTYVGTPFYMSPEICAAEKYTLKSDIWSMGCIIYELCAREPPFNAKTHFQLVQKIKEAKVAPLPDIYSPELNQVIRDCLKVNPDKRPDTAQLLNLPVVKLMRKEKEVVDLNKALKFREESLRRKEQEMNERLANMDRGKQMMREEIDSSLRREWEVKARLEIDRLTNIEMERLQKHFETEVKARVEAELQKKSVTFAPPEPQPPIEEYVSSTAKADYPHSSVGTSSDEFASTTDISEYSPDSTDSGKDVKKVARTPFGRAQTMFAGHAGTPMDIEMASPSPVTIANLSLSPRRNGATKVPSAKPSNIFTANAAASGDPRWEIHREDMFLESDDEEIVPSPTRNIKSTKNPFTSKNRPVLTSQKSCPLNRLKPQAPGTGFVSKAVSASQPEPGPRSPTGRLSKIPSVANLNQEPGNATGALSRKPSVKRDGTTPNNAADMLGKTAAKNNIKGRTLVELQQARAGGRLLGGTAVVVGGENVSPKRGAAFRDRIMGERRSSGDNEPVAVWDPERDEMPSPFLSRQRRIARA